MRGQLDPSLIESENERVDPMLARLEDIVRLTHPGGTILPRLEIAQDVGQPGTKRVRPSSPAGT